MNTLPVDEWTTAISKTAIIRNHDVLGIIAILPTLRTWTQYRKFTTKTAMASDVFQVEGYDRPTENDISTLLCADKHLPGLLMLLKEYIVQRLDLLKHSTFKAFHPHLLRSQIQDNLYSINSVELLGENCYNISIRSQIIDDEYLYLVVKAREDTLIGFDINVMLDGEDVTLDNI